MEALRGQGDDQGVVVPDKTLPSTQEKVLMQQVTQHGFIYAFV